MIKAVEPSDVQESVSATLKRLISGLFVLWSGAVFMLIFCEIYLHLQSLFLWHKLQARVVLLKLRTIFLCLFWYVLEGDVSTNYHYYKCFIFLQDLKVFLYQLKDHICYCYRITEFISKM